MDPSQLKLQQIAAQLPEQQLKEVIDFAEFIAFRNKNGVKENNHQPSRLKRLELPSMKDVKFTGDPLLRRKDLYDDWGR